MKEYETLSTVRSKVDVYLDEVHVGYAIIEPMGEASRFCGSWVYRYRYYPFIFVPAQRDGIGESIQFAALFDSQLNENHSIGSDENEVNDGRRMAFGYSKITVTVKEVVVTSSLGKTYRRLPKTIRHWKPLPLQEDEPLDGAHRIVYASIFIFGFLCLRQ